MEDIEKKYLSEDSTINIVESSTLKDFFFYTLSICGLLLYVGTNFYITIIADYQLFVWHPILMTFVILFSTQGIFILQKATKKNRSLWYHKWAQLLGLGCLIAGFTIVSYNKMIKGKTHFKSFHAKIGLTTFILYIIQLIAGLTLIYIPCLFGGVLKSKKYYGIHRFIGYIILSLIWLTALTSTRTHWITVNFNQDWIWIVSIGMTFLGIIGRINLDKIRFC